MQGFDLSIRAPRRRTCRVRVGVGVLDALVDDLAANPPGSPLVVVSDDRVAPLWGAPLARRLEARGLRAPLLTFPHGEAAKTRATKAALEDRLLELGAGRDAAIVAVGGGVTGDLAGFLAATWQRGIPVVQVPTSLLAMADAALGGKTAVNLGGGKNLVGAFHQPLAVWADVSTLATLPPERYVEGFAEVVKSAAVGDPALFRRLERQVESLASRDGATLGRVVEACMKLKGRVVARDEREAGRRAVLNFGHTVGHAIEAASAYTVHHGHAVAAGMCVEAGIACRETGLPASHAARLRRLVERLGLPSRPPDDLAFEDVLAATRHDKKAREGRVRYALPVRLGRMLPGAEVTVAVDDAAVERAWHEAAAGGLAEPGVD